MARSRIYTRNEEIANTLSHAAGILLGIVAGSILLSKAVASANSWAIASVVVYLFGMLACYIISTNYHAYPEGRTKNIWQKIDHASIYLHIAGTYTPFTLIVLREQAYWGWSLFAFVWLAALIGIILSFRSSDQHSHLETVCYVLMGSSIFAAIVPLINTLDALHQMSALYWLLAGGASYIVGALFYSWAQKPYMHTIFHIFVLGGSVCHIMAIYAIL